MDDWKGAALCFASYQYMRHLRQKSDELPNEFKVVVSLIEETVSHDEYVAAVATIKRLTESVLFEDWPEARELRRYLELNTVN